MKYYDKYDYTPEGYFIVDHHKYNAAIKDQKKYKRTKLKAHLFLLIPICGIIPYSEYMEDKLGVQAF